MQTPNWDDLRFFVALCEAGTLTGAARATGVEHTTVARRIEALETALGARLFDRFPKGWSLTAAGTVLVPHARKVEDDMYALLNAARATNAVTGVVRVSAPPALASCLLAPRLRAPLARLPGVEIDLRAEAHTTDLMRRQADIALRFARPTSPGLATKLLAHIDYALYAHEDYVANRAPEQWEFVGYDEQLQNAPQQEWLDKVRGERRTCMRSNDMLTLLRAAIECCGVGVFPCYATAGVPGLVALTPACPVRRKLWLVMHDDVRRAPHVRAVANEITAMFAHESDRGSTGPAE